jgi:hypothetical protein
MIRRKSSAFAVSEAQSWESRAFRCASLLWRTPAKLGWGRTRVLQDKAGETPNSVGSVHGVFSATYQLFAGFRHSEGIPTSMHVNNAATRKMWKIEDVAAKLHHQGQWRIAAGNLISNIGAVLQGNDVFSLSRSDQHESGHGGNQKTLHGFNSRGLTDPSYSLAPAPEPPF